MRTIISFYIAVFLAFLIALFAFFIMLYSNTTASAVVTEQITILSSSFEMKNINALLASKIKHVYVYLPIYDFLITASFGDGYEKQFSIDILNKTIIEYSKKGVYFGYCVNKTCYNCEGMIPLPTRYGNVILCSIKFKGLVVIGDKC